MSKMLYCNDCKSSSDTAHAPATVNATAIVNVQTGEFVDWAVSPFEGEEFINTDDMLCPRCSGNDTKVVKSIDI